MIQTNSLELYIKDKMGDRYPVLQENGEFFKFYFSEGIFNFGFAGYQSVTDDQSSIKYTMMPFMQIEKIFYVYSLRLDYEISKDSFDENPDLEHYYKLFTSTFLQDILEVSEIGIASENFRNGPFVEPEQKMYDI